MSDYYGNEYSQADTGNRRWLNVAATGAGLVALLGFFLTWISVAGFDINGFWIAIGGGFLTGGLLSCLCLVPLLGLALAGISLVALAQGPSSYTAYVQFAIATLLLLPVTIILLGVLGVGGIVSTIANLTVGGSKPNISGGISLGLGFWFAVVAIVVCIAAAISNLRAGGSNMEDHSSYGGGGGVDEY